MTNILTSRQVLFLKTLGQEKFLSNFYLTGGTALAGFYLYHRISEDLDFFSESEFEIIEIDTFIKNIETKLKISKINYQQSFNRNIFFLHFKKEILKTEFTYFPFPRIKKGAKKFNIEIDSITDIAVNKLFSIYQRAYARDFIDLYIICQEKNLSIKELTAKAKQKFDWHIDPIQLGSQFIKSKEVKDYPRMIINLKHQKWQRFFIKEAEKLKKDILE